MQADADVERRGRHPGDRGVTVDVGRLDVCHDGEFAGVLADGDVEKLDGSAGRNGLRAVIFDVEG